MKIKMKVSLSGPEYNLVPNEVTDRFGKKEALRLCKAGYAEPVDASEAETAEPEPEAEPETEGEA
jgi:hypothetical protein